MPTHPLALPARSPNSTMKKEPWRRGRVTVLVPIQDVSQLFPGGCRTFPVSWSTCPLPTTKPKTL